jgi:cytochrome b561
MLEEVPAYKKSSLLVVNQPRWKAKIVGLLMLVLLLLVIGLVVLGVMITVVDQPTVGIRPTLTPTL